MNNKGLILIKKQ